MENNYFSLEVNNNNKVIRIFQIIFGIICAVLAIVWLIINRDSLKSNSTLWFSIIFLLGFAWYQINSGLGKGDKFLQIDKTSLKFKKNSLLPASVVSSSVIEKIEIFPLSMIILMKSGKKDIIRFGTTYTDNLEPIKKGIEGFCTANNLELEFRNEEI